MRPLSHSSAAGDAALDFDAFHERHWDPLLLETLAVCGDLAAARVAVRAALVDLWQHWSSVTDGAGAERGPDVSALAFARRGALHRATRRSRPRAFKRSGRLSTEQNHTLEVLRELPYAERVCVVLACLTDLSVRATGEVVGVSAETADRLLDEGLDRVSAALARPVDALPARLRELEPLVQEAGRPAAHDLRRGGVRRGRVLLAVGSAAAVALTVLAGMFVKGDETGPSAADLPPQLGPTVSDDLLLTASDLAPLGRAKQWREVSTSRNTSGTGLNVTCQRDRFADPQGLRAFVRTFATSGTSAATRRTATQTIELSRSTDQARKGYATALDWFAGCRQAQTQLVSSYDVTGLGDQATVLRFRTQAAARSTFAVGLVRTGNITTWTSVTGPGDDPVQPGKLSKVLTASLTRACTSRAAGGCSETPQVEQAPPPPSGEQPGMLAAVDLPPIDSIRLPWVGTDAEAATTNPAATGCDQTDFPESGADPARTRTFLIPGAEVPQRFGLSETYGRYATPAAAQAVLAQVTKKMDTCPKRELGSEIPEKAASGSKAQHPYALWRLTTKVSEKSTVSFWMGVTRVGPYLAQVGFVPGTEGQDITQQGFTDLMERSRDRLVELSSVETSPSATGSPTPSSSGSPSPASDPTSRPSS